MNLSINLMMLLTSLLSSLNMDPQIKNASTYGAKAAIEEPTPKEGLAETSSKLDTWMWKTSPISKEKAVYLIVPYAIGKFTAEKRISTSEFSELKMPFVFGTTIGPQFEYSWKDQPITYSMLVVKKTF